MTKAINKYLQNNRKPFEKSVFDPRKRVLAENQDKKFVSGDTVPYYQTFEGAKESYSADYGAKKIISAARNNFPMDIDISWLPAAAATYDISPDINDYVLCDVAAVTIDIPNRNLQAFPYEEVTYFDHAYGKMVYQTFVGKPSCADHKNEVDQNSDYAKGVIFAATMQYVPTFDVWKVRLLQGFDRGKDTRLANAILNGKRKYFSMGALVSNFIDPISGQIENTANPPYPKGSIYMGNLVFSLCLGCCYIENSSVHEPADPFADGVVL